MKIKITKTDFSENGGKLFLSYLENISSWESNKENRPLLSKKGRISPKMKPKVGQKHTKTIQLFNSKIDAMRNLKLLTEQIVAKILSDSGISLNSRSLEAAKKKIQKTFISADSVKQNFDVEIEFDSETGHCTLEHKSLNSKHAAEEKPKLELDQSMEFDADPGHSETTRSTGSESMENGEVKTEILEATKTGQSESTDTQGEKSSNDSNTESKCNFVTSDAPKIEEDVEMKPESNSEDGKINDLEVPMMGQSSPYSPSKLSDCLKKEDVQQLPDSDLKDEIKYLTKISDESKVSWTSFLNGVESLPSSPAKPSEDKHQKTSEENDTKSEESDALKPTTQLQSNVERTAEPPEEASVEAEIETKEKMATDSIEKSSGSDSSEHATHKHDVFLPEDLQMLPTKNNEGQMNLDEVTGILSAQINE